MKCDRQAVARSIACIMVDLGPTDRAAGVIENFGASFRMGGRAMWDQG